MSSRIEDAGIDGVITIGPVISTRPYGIDPDSKRKISDIARYIDSRIKRDSFVSLLQLVTHQE